MKIFRMLFLFLSGFFGVIAIIAGIATIAEESADSLIGFFFIIIAIVCFGLLAEFFHLEDRIKQLEEKIDKQNKE